MNIFIDELNFLGIKIHFLSLLLYIGIGLAMLIIFKRRRYPILLMIPLGVSILFFDTGSFETMWNMVFLVTHMTPISSRYLSGLMNGLYHGAALLVGAKLYSVLSKDLKIGLFDKKHAMLMIIVVIAWIFYIFPPFPHVDVGYTFFPMWDDNGARDIGLRLLNDIVKYVHTIVITYLLLGRRS